MIDGQTRGDTVRFDFHRARTRERLLYAAPIIISALAVRVLFPAVHAARIDIDSLCQGARGRCGRARKTVA